MLIRWVPSSPVPDRAFVPQQKRFTTCKASFPHAAWLGQSSDHCPISLTAASRRSLVPVSVPVWGTVLSNPLAIAALVGRRPANQLMARMPVPDRIAALSLRGCPPREPWRIIRRFHRLSARRGVVAYALRTRAPLSRPPKGPFPYDLHVLGLPLAFILSQDQTLRCTIVLLIFSLNLGFRFDTRPKPPGQGPLIPRAAPAAPVFSCAGLRLSKNLRFRIPSDKSPRSFRKRVQKYYLFPDWQAFFFKYFSCLSQ